MSLFDHEDRHLLERFIETMSALSDAVSANTDAVTALTASTDALTAAVAADAGGARCRRRRHRSDRQHSPDRNRSGCCGRRYHGSGRDSSGSSGGS